MNQVIEPKVGEKPQNKYHDDPFFHDAPVGRQDSRDLQKHVFVKP
jgi:hypothetical protein